ncbi:hypothetical protein O181_007802 [Austropuccinia psidii MF-1]|uniref:Reverse transcriptase/retrotransposon-derived protein RNase H-like domain-containing protein n=1 Tax=Austropuccinia psidii MF-1 TaxID=1389203 RepID=A0A9Q3GIU9_9BASI|nr:hypothetical protein [Austropuccinia psidii MF-1]
MLFQESKHSNLFLALPTSIVISLKIIPKISAFTSLLKKDSPFIFNEEALSQFQILKETFSTPPILSHFNPSLPTLLENDSSHYSLGAALSQVDDSGKHPISFNSASFSLLSSNHSSLQHFMSSKFLTCCQASWAEFLSEFFFSITYRPGRLATLPDALSHWDDMYPERGLDFISKNTQNLH